MHRRFTAQMVFDWDRAERVHEWVAISEYQKRMGETHHNARIPDALVERIRNLHEYYEFGYKALAEEFNLSKNTVRKICTYERRALVPVRWKRIPVSR